MEETALQVVESSSSQMTRPQTFSPGTFSEALVFADKLAKSSLIPKEFQGHPENILVAIQHGAEIGLQPLQALNSICVINSRPAVFGDAALAIVKGHREFEWIREDVDEVKMVATCVVKRRGQPEVTQRFSQADAVKAGLWEKAGPWKQYPTRMLKMRARGFALRDAFPDALRGIITAEEAEDYPGPTIDARATPPPELQQQTETKAEPPKDEPIGPEKATAWYKEYRAHGWMPADAAAWLKDTLGIEPPKDSRSIPSSRYEEAMKWAATNSPLLEEINVAIGNLDLTRDEAHKFILERKHDWPAIREALLQAIAKRDEAEKF